MEDKEVNIETKKPPETTGSSSKENASEILHSTARKIENLLQGHEIKPEEATLKVNKYNLDIESTRPEWGTFSFWGGLVNNLSFFELQTQKEYVPVIKNLRLPNNERGEGLGSAIVKTWEKSMENNGYINFAVTNLKNPKAISFWQGHGYKIPEAEKHKKIPYYMYKKI